MIDWEKARAALMGAGGIYLMYTAYSLFKGRFDDSSMPLGVNYAFSIFFALIGIAIAVYAVILWKRAKAKAEELEKAYAAEKNAEDPDNTEDQKTE